MSIAFSTSSLSIQLKNPELSNVEVVDPLIKIKTMMDGSVRAYRRTTAKQRLTLTFENLTRDKVMELRAFVVATAARIVQYLDFDGAVWSGRFLDQQVDISTPNRGPGAPTIRQEANTVVVQYEGVKL